jgi:pimeloyl-ACP methyl ester carboxylesterase
MNRLSHLITAAVCTMFGGAALAADAGPVGPVRNIVLVHGAFVDGSGWNAIATILRKHGYSVAIVQEPETSLADDVAATNRIIDRQEGPVVLVGHSYGGFVITEAGNNPQVKALVYVAAFQPDAGENLAKLGASIPPASTAVAPSKDGFLFIDPAAFHNDFCADLPQERAELMARSQLPLSLAAATADIVAPAWRQKPSYAIVATQDRSINPELERFMFKRSHAVTVEIKGSHAIYMSQPEAVARVIEQAAKASL